MQAANMFVATLITNSQADQVASVHVELFGSLGATGHGDGSVEAVLLGLEGHAPDTADAAINRPRSRV